MLPLSVPAEPENLKHPDWHPDGRQLASEGSCHGNTGLYLIDTVTGELQLLFDSPHVDGYPRWFPDGRRVAFHQIDEDRESRILIADFSRDDADPLPITGGPFDIEPAPSPDGSLLAYSTSGEGGQDIAILDIASDDVVVWKTATAENFPSWHPDGESLVFHARQAADSHIYLRSRDAAEPRIVDTGPGPNLVANLAADGSRLVFSSERDGDREIYLQRLDDGALERLTNRPGRDGYPKFSPDGTRIAYHAEIDGERTIVTVLDLRSGESKSFACPRAVESPHD